MNNCVQDTYTSNTPAGHHLCFRLGLSCWISLSGQLAFILPGMTWPLDTVKACTVTERRRHRVHFRLCCNIQHTLPWLGPRRQRRCQFWMRPGLTSCFWDTFEKEAVVQEERLENVCMSKTPLLSLCELLRPTEMRSPVRKDACALYYLAEEDSVFCIFMWAEKKQLQRYLSHKIKKEFKSGVLRTNSQSLERRCSVAWW